MMDSGNPGQAALLRLAGLPSARGAIFALLFALLPFQQTMAHDPGLSSLTIRQRPDGVEATLTLAVKDAVQLVDHDGSVTQAELARARSELEAAVAKQLFVAADGKVLTVQSIRSNFDEKNNVEVHLNFGPVRFSKLEIQSNLVASLPLGHRQYLQVQNSAGKAVSEKLLSAAADRATAEFTATDANVPSREIGSSFA